MHVKTAFLLTLGMVTGLAAAAPVEDLLPTGTTEVKGATKVESAPEITCTTLDWLGWIDMSCDYNDAIGQHTGAHAKCATYCAQLGDHVSDCYDARCKQRPGMTGGEGQCYCPCGSRIVCW